MALVATTAWEIRATGSANNGSGYNDRIPGTSVDYSRQNASQLSINDLVGAVASVTVTSVIGGFTQAMVGNVMRIRGGVNFTVGFYEIVLWNSANSVNLDSVPVTGIGANGLAEVGGGQINLNLIDTVVVPGNTVWIKSDTYAAHPITGFTAITTIYLPLGILGYDVARGDNPTGDNRPLLQFTGANTLTFTAGGSATHTKIRNIRFEFSSGRLGIQANGSSTLLENCKIYSGGSYCFLANIGGRIICIDCEFYGMIATTIGIYSASSLIAVNSYFHDLEIGISSGSDLEEKIFFSIFHNCQTAGIHDNGNSHHKIINCTFSSIPRGFYQTVAASQSALFMNNTFSDCSIAGIVSVNAKIMNNNFFNCAAIVIGSNYGLEDNNMFVNPQFVTPGSVFALQRTSGLIDKAFSMRLGV